jgi:hypothetical protein
MATSQTYFVPLCGRGVAMFVPDSQSDMNEPQGRATACTQAVSEGATWQGVGSSHGWR